MHAWEYIVLDDPMITLYVIHYEALMETKIKAFPALIKKLEYMSIWALCWNTICRCFVVLAQTNKNHIAIHKFTILYFHGVSLE